MMNTFECVRKEVMWLVWIGQRGSQVTSGASAGGVNKPTRFLLFATGARRLSQAIGYGFLEEMRMFAISGRS
jgi:hypothetical protein